MIFRESSAKPSRSRAARAARRHPARRTRRCAGSPVRRSGPFHWKALRKHCGRVRAAGEQHVPVAGQPGRALLVALVAAEHGRHVVLHPLQWGAVPGLQEPGAGRLDQIGREVLVVDPEPGAGQLPVVGRRVPLDLARLRVGQPQRRVVGPDDLQSVRSARPTARRDSGEHRRSARRGRIRRRPCSYAAASDRARTAGASRRSSGRRGGTATSAAGPRSRCAPGPVRCVASRPA